MTEGFLAHGRGMTVAKRDGTLVSSALIGIDESYSVVYRTNPSDKIGYWIQIPAHSRRGLYQQIKTELELLHEKYDFDKNQLTVNLDESRDRDPDFLHMLEQMKYTAYTTLPEHFPDRVRTLAHHITQYFESDYTKANVITRFLNQFPY